MTGTHYADDQVFLVNTPVLAESRLLSLEQNAEGTGLYVNADKTDFIRFQQGVVSI